MINKIQPNFIHLNKITFAEYVIIYHINDCFSIRELSSIHSKHILLFQKFKNKVQQINLMIIDTIFPIIIADVATSLLIKKVASFKQYAISSDKYLLGFDIPVKNYYFQYKFHKFINYLLFSDVASDNPSKGEIQTDKVYCLKNDSEEIKYYSIFEQRELQELLFEKIVLSIDPIKSNISKQEVHLTFKISFD